MIAYIPQEEVFSYWPTISEELKKYWSVGINFETIPNLKRRLLAEDCRLWMWTHEELGARCLFVTEDHVTATAKILTVTHCAGMNNSGKRWDREKLSKVFKQMFDEIEDLALTLYFDAVCVHARPGHAKLMQEYKPMCQPIVKQLITRRE